MEVIAGLNHSILSKLPLEIQSIIKSLPLSDYSLFLISGAVIVGGLLLLLSFSKETPQVIIEEPLLVVKNNPRDSVKVKIFGNKKTRRGKKKSKEAVSEPVKEETKIEESQEIIEEEGWNQVKPKKIKKEE
jgi:hypothetical protein